MLYRAARNKFRATGEGCNERRPEGAEDEWMVGWIRPDGLRARERHISLSLLIQDSGLIF